jgi:hypothetical protein
MKHLLLLCFVLFTLIGKAQDTIIKKNGDLIRAKIMEIGTADVKFKISGQPDGATITLKRSDIKTAIVGGQLVINSGEDQGAAKEDVIVKKSGDMLKVKVIEIGTEEIKFKLFNNPDGPTISMLKSEIRSMKVQGQTVIDNKTGLTEDLILKTDGTLIKAKISEIGAGEVKYKLYSTPDGPVLTVKKQDVDNIKIDGQTVYEHKDDPLSVSNNRILDRTNTLKFYFFSPLNHNLAFGYEWMHKPGFNWDVALGIIGPGVTSQDKNTHHPRGLFLRGGPKFLLGSSSDVVTEDTKDRYAHPLRGKYIKVEAILNAFSSTNRIDTIGYFSVNGTSGVRYVKKYQSLTINIQYGKQYIFGNAMTLAWFLGVGYSFENVTSNLPAKYNSFYYGTDVTRYSHTYFGQRFPMIFTSGLTVGFILPAPKVTANKKVHHVQPATRHSMNDQK